MPSLPHAERAEVIRSYARKYEIKHFIETGTNTGDTVAILLDEFDSIVTIEIDPDLTEFARERFGDHLKVNCVNADSGEFIRDMVPYLTEPVIYWLDGHFCGGAVHPEIDTPIREELIAALQSPPGSVILIDDARLFGSMEEHTEEYKDYPEINWVCYQAVQAGYEWLIEDDIIRITPCSR
jgi:hypothetical protein